MFQHFISGISDVLFGSCDLSYLILNFLTPFILVNSIPISISKEGLLTVIFLEIHCDMKLTKMAKYVTVIHVSLKEVQDMT